MGKKFFTVIIFSFVLLTGVFSQQKTGVTLCNEIFNTLQNNNFNPKKQQLVNSLENDFPYNIYVNFPSASNDKHNSSILLFNFFIEDSLNYSQDIIKSLEELRNHNFDFDILILFSYGDKATFDKQGITKGIPSFFEHISSFENSFAIIIDLDGNKNNIITASHGKQSPSWFIENEANIFMKHNISSSLPLYLVSQLYRYDFLVDRHLDEYFSRGIPAIKISLDVKNLANEIIVKVISDSAEYFSKTPFKVWDNHFILINFLNSYYKIGEDVIVKIIISIFFSFSLFIFILFFIISSNRFNSWKIIKKIWYTFPCTLIFELVGFWISKNGYNLFAKHLTEIGKIYFLIGSHICMAFLILSIFYVLVSIYITNFEERSIDYLIVLSTFANQLLFLFVDISLFPIFMLIFVISLFCMNVKNRKYHVFLFIFIILIFVPYAHKIIILPEVSSLKSFIVTTPHIAFYLGMILCPLFLIYFRILTSYKYFLRTPAKLIVFSAVYTVLIFITCISIGIIRSHNINKNSIPEKSPLIRTKKDESIMLTYSDKKVFSDIIRTINITTSEIPEYCDIRVSSEKVNPILYSENTYEIINDNTAVFVTPYNPPEKLTFSYAANKAPSSIIITALYRSDTENEYWMERKILKIK